MIDNSIVTTELKKILASVIPPGTADGDVNVFVACQVPWWLLNQAIKEIEKLHSLVGQARVSGPNVSDIKEAGGRSFTREGA